jgi:hypothetical protein
MRFFLCAVVAVLTSATACMAQVSTMGTTAMGLASTPGAIVSSPLNGPSPFSAATQPGTPVTTLAPVPLALDPTTPGTSINCSPLPATTTLTPATAPVTVTATIASTPALGTIGAPAAMTPPPAPATVTPAIPAFELGEVTAPPIPVPAPVTAAPLSTNMATAAAISAATGAAATTSTIPLATPTTLPFTPGNASQTGTIVPITALGNTTPTGCTASTATSSINGATLPLATPELPANPPPGTIQSDVTELANTSIDPTMSVIPTPNSASCSEAITMDLANPGMMAPANATGATATPGVSPPGC